MITNLEFYLYQIETNNEEDIRNEHLYIYIYIYI